MTLKTFIAAIAVCQMAALPSLSQAQSSDFDRTYLRQGAEARLSFSIPIGESSDRSKTKPRLDFAVRNYAQPSNQSLDWMMIDNDRFGQNAYSETRLSFTLENDPQWMLNDQTLDFGLEDDQANIGTAGKIGIGVVAVALVAVAAVAVIVVACDADDCWDGDD